MSRKNEEKDKTCKPAFMNANPGILGLFAFATTTMIAGFRLADIIPDTSFGVVLGLAIFYGGIAQLLAGIFEFTKGNTFGMVAFISYGSFWLSLVVLENTTDLFPNNQVPADAAGLSTFFFWWGIITVVLFIAVWRKNLAIMAVFLLLAATFMFLGVTEILFFYDVAGGDTMRNISGYLAILTAIAAYFTGSAELLGWPLGETLVKEGKLVWPCRDKTKEEETEARNLRIRERSYSQEDRESLRLRERSFSYEQQVPLEDIEIQANPA